MTKKATAKPKGSKAKPQKTKAVTSSKASSGRVPPAKPAPPPDPRYSHALENYQAGIKALQERKFERALGLLQKVLEGPSRELADRAAVHMSSARQNLAKAATSFGSAEEHYDYAVALINGGDYEGARNHLEQIVKKTPKADYAVYGLSVLDCLEGKVEDALRRLDQAIKMNPQNRLQARNDTDFKNLADDPRFTELLYPESEGR
jgi:tetratricopeptide (TPR) repeat protein